MYVHVAKHTHLCQSVPTLGFRLLSLHSLPLPHCHGRKSVSKAKQKSDKPESPWCKQKYSDSHVPQLTQLKREGVFHASVFQFSSIAYSSMSIAYYLLSDKWLTLEQLLWKPSNIALLIRMGQTHAVLNVSCKQSNLNKGIINLLRNPFTISKENLCEDYPCKSCP